MVQLKLQKKELKYISNFLLCRKPLAEISLHSSLKKIGDYGFYGCLSIIEVIILDSVNLINESVFEECLSLKGVAER